MCMEYSLRCECGRKEASFNFRDDIMPPEVISRLYCPECSKEIRLDPERMIADNGWVIEYDMDIARFAATKTPHLLVKKLTPEVLFDEGYATWRGVYPGDHIDSARERQALVALAKTDPKAYLEKIKTWGIERMKRLRAEGWRKANAE